MGTLSTNQVAEFQKEFENLGFLLTHNREYWNASLYVVVKNIYQFGLWTLISNAYNFS